MTRTTQIAKEKASENDKHQIQDSGYILQQKITAGEEKTVNFNSLYKYKVYIYKSFTLYAYIK